MKRIYTILFATALAAGCDNKPKANKEPPPTPAVASGSDMAAGSAGSADGSGMAAGSAGSAGSAAGSADTADLEVPTEADFEAEATAKITEKNLEAEVKALEEQLAQ